MAQKKERRSSPKKGKQVRPILHDRPLAGRGGKQPHAERHVERTGCRNPEVRKGIGGVIFALGIPTAIAGLVMTITDATDNSTENKYPNWFSAVGPVLLVISAILFFIGLLLVTTCMLDALHQCFSFDNPEGFCRVHCPRLSNCISPDDSMVIRGAAMNALKTEPGKSALKRQFAPVVVLCDDDAAATRLTADFNQEKRSEQINGGDAAVRSLTSIDVVSEVENGQKLRVGTKGVRFSESDTGVYNDTHRTRAFSAASVSSDNGSTLSVRHCKVHPKEDIWHTDDREEVFPGLASETMTTEL